MTGVYKKETDGNMNRITKKLKELSDLLHIPEVEAVISKALEEAKEKYSDEIEEYLKNNLEKQIGKRLSKDKRYFFEARKVVDEKGESRWVLENLKLEADPETVNMIFSDLLEKLDEYETAPNGIQNETVIPPYQKKIFQIYFIKGTDTNVSGFVKIVEEDFVVRNNTNIVTLNNHASENLGKEVLIQLMDENDEFTKDISFALRMNMMANGTAHE